MYLVTIARLREGDRPLPLSRLAKELSISPISANEMCRKMQDEELVVYRPYKGVSLTPEGEQRACYVLRRHRLWEVFLVRQLGFDIPLSIQKAYRFPGPTAISLPRSLCARCLPSMLDRGVMWSAARWTMPRSPFWRRMEYDREPDLCWSPQPRKACWWKWVCQRSRFRGDWRMQFKWS